MCHPRGRNENLAETIVMLFGEIQRSVCQRQPTSLTSMLLSLPPSSLQNQEAYPPARIVKTYV